MSDESWDSPVEATSSVSDSSSSHEAYEPSSVGTADEGPSVAERDEQPEISPKDDGVDLSGEDRESEETSSDEQSVVENMAALKNGDAPAEEKAEQPAEGADAVKEAQKTEAAGKTEGGEKEKPTQNFQPERNSEPRRTHLENGRLLAAGASGDDVRRVQQMLNEQTGAGLAVDGKMGPQTEAALRKLQGDRGLLVDGIVGPQTAGSLNAWRADGNHDMHAYNGGDYYRDRGASGANPAGGAQQLTGTGGPAPLAGPGAPARPGSGQAAVQLAERYLGMNSRDVRGQMPHFTAAGGQTNNCADFVSSALESQGLVRGHHINVREFERSLLSQGYVRVPQSQAQPGDVWINGSRGHTELVATPGATRLIGSNNDRPGHQVISYGVPRGGYFYQLRRQ